MSRLEEITTVKIGRKIHDGSYVEVVELDVEDYQHIFKQAQKSEELQAKVDGLKKEKDEWKGTAQSYYVTNQELREKNKRYKQGLEFYADRFKYHEMLDQSGVLTVIEDDCGFTAREALEHNQHG